MTILAGAWAWVCKWAIIIGAAALAVVVAIFYGREKGKAVMQPKVDAANAKADAAAVNTGQLESRHETDVAIDKLPDAPAQSVADADSNSAAGQLRDGGFTRD